MSSSYALKIDRTLWTWDDNTYGQLGDNGKTSQSLPFYAAAGIQKTFSTTRYVLRDDGSIWGWGRNYRGEIDNTWTDKLLPTVIGEDTLYFTTRAPAQPFRL